MLENQTEALVCSKITSDLTGLNIGTVKTADLDKNSVRINIKAAALNFPDLLLSLIHI